MTNAILLYLASALPAIWGTAHLFPTKNVVKGFGDISDDNKRIITMEWIIEGAALIFVGVVVFAATIIDQTHEVSRAVYWLAFAMLNVLSLISLFTGFRVNFLPFRLCPFIFTGSSVLIVLGILV